MDLFLGVDGGGTRTRALLVTREGRVVGRGEAGPANYHNVGLEVTERNLRSAAEAAWKAMGRAPRPAAAAFVGCAGVKAAVDVAAVRSASERAGLAAPGDIAVANDLYNALAGGLAGRPGIAVIAGTGTNCLGQDDSGRTFMCGGWGWLLDDEGGGFGLALAAMKAVARGADGRAASTRLQPALLAYLGLSEPDELLARLYVRPWTPDELAGFAPVVLRLASEGDGVAHGLIEEGARALAGLVRGAAAELRFPEGPAVVLLGGCALSGPPYQPLIERAIHAAVSGARIVTATYAPPEGAALNALRQGGVFPLPRLT